MAAVVLWEWSPWLQYTGCEMLLYPASLHPFSSSGKSFTMENQAIDLMQSFNVFKEIFSGVCDRILLDFKGGI